MRRQADGFSGDVTPLFETMIVQANEEVQKKQKPRRKQKKEIKSPQHEFEDEDPVPTFSNDPLPSGEDSSDLNELMAKEIANLKKTVKKLQRQRRSRPAGLRRLKKFGARKSKSSMDIDSLGDQEDSSKQGRNEDNFVQDEALKQLYKKEMFGVDDLHGEEVTVEDTAAKEVTTV
ncbi:hypothetical protein Tco_0197861, partial [Tanacetum coccineum]